MLIPCIVRRPFPFTFLITKTLIIHGDKPGANPLPISCIKAQKCLHQKNYVFLTLVVDKTKDEVSIQGIPLACDFPDVFPEELPGIPPERQVEFQIDLILGTTSIANSPYRLTPAEIQKLSSQLRRIVAQRIHQTKLLTL